MNAFNRTVLIVLTTVVLETVSTSPAAAAPLGTAFSYQGRLSDGGEPGNGRYDLRFNLYTAALGGTAVGAGVTNQNVSVSNGLFTTTVDFGADVFTGDEYWLDLGVRPGSST